MPAQMHIWFCWRHFRGGKTEHRYFYNDEMRYFCRQQNPSVAAAASVALSEGALGRSRWAVLLHTWGWGTGEGSRVSR